MTKITFLAENCYVIRSTRTKPSGEVIVRYYVTPPTWNTSPMNATIFTDIEAGEAHLRLFQKRDVHGPWADGSAEVFDVVPLHGAITTGPGGITVRKQS